MAKQLALQLKITSEGTEKVISNINELETELKVLQDRLKTLDFGSAAFNEATLNISKLRTKIDEIDKASEGIGAEKRFRAIGDAVNVLTGSFQVLSGVLSLVITDEENLAEVQAAEKAALDVLNIALGINAINTALVESATLRKAAADKIATLATQAATLAQRAFNAVLAANPIALVVLAIGALTAAYVAFSEETKEVNKGLDEQKIKAETLEDLTTRSIKTRDDEIKKIQSLVAVSELDNLSRKDRVKVLKEIQKAYPDYLRNQNLEKVSLQQIKTANDKLVEGILKVARARAAADKLGEIQTKKLSIETAKQLAIESQRQQEQEAYNLLDASQTNKRIEVLRNLGKVRDQQSEKAVKELDFQEKVILNYIKENDLVGALAGGLGAAGDAAKEYTDLELQLIQKRIKALDDIILKIQEAQKVDIKYTSELIEKQKAVLDEQENFIKERTEFFKTEGEKLVDEINNYLFKTIPSVEEIKKLTDGYKGLFDEITTAVRSGQLDFKKATGWDEFVKFAETKLPGIGEKLKNVNEESRLSFVEYFNTLDDRVSAIKTKIDGAFLGFFPQQADAQTLQQLLDTEKQIAELRANRLQLGLDENALTNKSLQIIKQNFGIQDKINELAKEQANDTFNYYEAQRKGNKEEEKRLKTRIDERDKEVQTYNKVAQAILDGVIRTDEFVKGLVAVGVESDKNLEKILKLKGVISGAFSPDQLDGLKEYFKQNADDFLTIFTDILNREEEYFNKLGKDGITALFSGIDEGLVDVEGKTRKELENIQKFLKLFGDEFAKDFGLDENPFLKALDAITKKLKTLPTESEEAFKKTIENIKQIADTFLQVFSDISSRLSSIVQAQNSLLLEQLEYSKEASIKNIEEALGQSAEGDARIAEERAKIEKEYAKKRFEAEKQARISELQFTLANTIAQGAGAVVNALALPAPPPIPQIYAGVIAGLTAAQYAVINDQLQFAKNKVFIGRRGGLINGASHDDMSGGVPALLEGGEFVMNKEAVRQFGDIIGSINNSTGGRALTIDDSRLVQAIASQNTSKTPIKTYVLYNDIKDTNKLNNRIEQLSRL